MSKTQSKDTKLKWNFAMGLIHGTFFTGGQAFGNPNTILPVFLNNFTNSKMLIGFSSTISGTVAQYASYNFLFIITSTHVICYNSVKLANTLHHIHN